MLEDTAVLKAKRRVQDATTYLMVILLDDILRATWNKYAFVW